MNCIAVDLDLTWYVTIFSFLEICLQYNHSSELFQAFIETQQLLSIIKSFDSYETLGKNKRWGTGVFMLEMQGNLQKNLATVREGNEAISEPQDCALLVWSSIISSDISPCTSRSQWPHCSVPASLEDHGLHVNDTMNTHKGRPSRWLWH